MFKEGGHIYVYRSYGIHACANIVAGKPGVAEGVLIRAMEPTQGLELMRKRRGTKISADLCSGPGRLTQAMGITLEDNGADLLRGRFSLHKPDSSFGPVLSSPRIGITKATDKLWRFYFKNNGNITKHRFNRMGEAT
jgi:DNA-3-methyladenine glycosylase